MGEWSLEEATMSIFENKYFAFFCAFLFLEQIACRKSSDRKDVSNYESNEDPIKSLNKKSGNTNIDLYEESMPAKEKEDKEKRYKKHKHDHEHEGVHASSMISGSYLTTCAFIESKSDVICEFDSKSFERDTRGSEDTKLEIVVIVQIDDRYVPVEYTLQYYVNEEAWEIKIPKENLAKPQIEWTFCNGECKSDETMPSHDVLLAIDGNEVIDRDLSIVITKEKYIFRSL